MVVFLYSVFLFTDIETSHCGTIEFISLYLFYDGIKNVFIWTFDI